MYKKDILGSIHNNLQFSVQEHVKTTEERTRMDIMAFNMLHNSHESLILPAASCLLRDQANGPQDDYVSCAH